MNPNHINQWKDALLRAGSYSQWYWEIPGLQNLQGYTIYLIGALIFIVLALTAVLLWIFILRPLIKSTETPSTKNAQAPRPEARISRPISPPPPAQGSAPQNPGLQFTLDSGEIKTFTSLPIFVGRDSGNDLILEDETISANHARIYFDERAQAICIADSDSLNGLFVNNQPTRKNVLRDGARIRLGSVQIIFNDTGYSHSNSK